MKTKLAFIIPAFSLSFSSHAQIPVMQVIQEGIKKVIKAVDLEVQRLQTKTIMLQNAQKAVENEMSKLKLDEISGWVEKQRKLYANYFDELSKVKTAISAYHRVQDIIEKQSALVHEYKSAWNLLKQDKNFTTDELHYMRNVYTGMLDESIQNLDEVFLVVNAFTTQMTDAKRMEIINSVSDKVNEHLHDLRQFNDENKMLSFQRAAQYKDIEVTKKLYGLE
jgi:hypothetical protein